MPWKIEQREDKFCVVKKDDGDLVACHDSRDKANAQLKALYANETKELEILSAELEALAKEEETPTWLGRVTESITNTVKSLFVDKADAGSDMLIFKESGGAYQVICRYSNKFRDNDTPSEIIASESHQKFAKLVEAGITPAPDLWLWHMPEWKIGTGLWAAYDDSGFALSGHRIPPENAEIAEVLKSLKNVRVSHGMPKWSVRRASEDQSVIVEHITKEVSLLPGWAAANKFTSMVVLDSKENETMALSKEQKRLMLEEWKISPTLIDHLEAQNKEDATQLTLSGVENKETAQPTPPAAEPAPSDATKAAPDPVQSAPAAAEDLAAVTKALSETMAAVIALSQKVDGVVTVVKEMRQADADKVKAMAASTPLASMSELMKKSVVDSPDTIVDGRTSLAKSGPTQAPAAPAPQVTGIPFVDQFFAPSPAQVGSNGATQGGN